jgi:hypothetical protein
MSKQRRPITKCKRCKQEKRLPKYLQKGMVMEVYEREPYCSRKCAEQAAK